MLRRHHDDCELVRARPISVGDGYLSIGIESGALATSWSRIEIDSKVSVPFGDNRCIPRSVDQCPAALLWDEQPSCIVPGGGDGTRSRTAATHPQHRPGRLDADVAAGGDEAQPVRTGPGPLAIHPLQLVDSVHPIGPLDSQSVLRSMLQWGRAGQPEFTLEPGDTTSELVYATSLEENLLRTLHSEVFAARSAQPWRE